jgi:hypothetical protein
MSKYFDIQYAYVVPGSFQAENENLVVSHLWCEPKF